MSTRKRPGPIVAGVGFAVAYIVGWILTVTGLPQDFPPTADEIVNYYDDHAGTARAGAVVSALAAGFLIWFVASLRRSLRAAAGDDATAADTAAGGGWVAAALLLAANSANYLPAVRADDGLDPAQATVPYDLHSALTGVAAPLALGVLVAATAVTAFRHHAAPRWLAWVSTALAAGMIAPLAPWAASMLFPFWVLAITFGLRCPEHVEVPSGHRLAPAS
jgi:hypothetical protein